MIDVLVTLGLFSVGWQGSEVVTQLPGPGREVLPVLDFPEPGLDDTASYQGYQTRFYRDTKQNTVQIYLEPRGGRVVHLWANAANESIGFTARDASGRPARLTWASKEAEVAHVETGWVPGTEPKGRESTVQRTLAYHLTSDASRLDLGWFVLGSMRIERDFQYAKRHQRPYTAPPFQVAEESLLVADVARLPAGERERHLQLLHADRIADLRRRLFPIIVSPAPADTAPVVRIFRPSLDNRNTLTLELRPDTRETTIRVTQRTVSLRSRPGSPVRFTVRILTDAAPLTPLQRSEIFNRDFLAFLATARGTRDSAGVVRYRRLERQVRGVELLSSKEKLMAGLPNFATYFGRDMMMTALMMRPIWSAGMAEHVIASVLRKLGPRGDVSHEEALGGQAIRENAVVYDSLVRRNRLREARAVLASLQRTRENYHMIDDEFQLPVLVAGYLTDTTVAPARKLAFLRDSSDGRGSRLGLLFREMALVATWTRPYVEDPRATKLVSFPKRDATHWRSASWRDSDAGYAGGRFAMDVNAIWAPQALQSIAQILRSFDSLGLSDSSWTPAIDTTPLGQYHRHPASLSRAIEVWRGARRHFEVTLPPDQVQRRVKAKLASLPLAEQQYWQRVSANTESITDSLFFLALSLDADGRPIPVVNTDPATGLFLDALSPSSDSGSASRLTERDLRTFVLPYPVGLLVDSLGPLVANDAYASPRIWERFRDLYHSPRVVWGREVNLILLGLGRAPEGRYDSWLRRIVRAVEASNLAHNELWSYRIDGDRLLATRYGTSSDVQLWNTTDLAVEFVLSRLPGR